MEKKKCVLCGVEKVEATEFYKYTSRSGKQYHYGKCKDCYNLSIKQKYHSKEKAKEVKNEYMRVYMRDYYRGRSKSNIKIDFFNTKITLDNGDVIHILDSVTPEEEIRLKKEGYYFIFKDVKKGKKTT